MKKWTITFWTLKGPYRQFIWSAQPKIGVLQYAINTHRFFHRPLPLFITTKSGFHD